MRIFGWVLGGLFLADGLFALIGRRDAVKMMNSTVGKWMPGGVSKTLKRAADVNETAVSAMGVNNVLAGAGMLLVALLASGKQSKTWWSSWMRALS